MAYPNSGSYNIVIPQTSGSAVAPGQYPFTEVIISGSNLVLQTNASGQLVGLPAGTITTVSASTVFTSNLTASNISASGFITASTGFISTFSSSNVWINNLTVPGTLNATASNATNAISTSITDTTTGTGPYYVTFVDRSSGVQGTRVDSTGLQWNATTNTLSLPSGNVSASALTASTAIWTPFVSASAVTSSRIFATTLISSSVFSASAIAVSVISASSIAVSQSLTVPILIVTSGSSSTSKDTGAVILQAGGLGVEENIFAGGLISGSGISSSGITINGNLNFVNGTRLIAPVSNSAAGLTLQVKGGYSSANIGGDLYIAGGNTGAGGGAAGGIIYIDAGAGTTTPTVQPNVVVNSLSPSASLLIAGGNPTASLKVWGGAQIGGFGSNTAVFISSSGTSVGIGARPTPNAKGLTVTDGKIYLSETVSDSTFVIDNEADSSGYLTFYVSQSLTRSMAMSSTQIDIPITMQATSWNNGALKVDGGVGIGKNLWVSGSMTVVGDLTLLGSSSIVNITSSQVNFNDNILRLNAYSPFERYAGIEVNDSGSATLSGSILWDGSNNQWVVVDQNAKSGIVIVGPTGSLGSEGSLTLNTLPKAYDGHGLTNSSIVDDGTILRYGGNRISASHLFVNTLTASIVSSSVAITGSNLWVGGSGTSGTGSITYASGVLVTYTTGSFTTLTIQTGSSPGIGLAPATATAVGMPGQIEVDNNYMYIYTNNVWKRVPLSVWAP